MALQKSIATQFGIDAVYHKIVKIDDDRLAMTATIIVNGYVSSNYQGKMPAISQAFVAGSGDFVDMPYCFQTSEIDPEGMNHVERAYLAIKTLDVFNGATDV